MTKSELKTGYIVEMGNGTKYMVFKDTFDKEDKLITIDCGFMFLYNYSADLTYIYSGHAWDIVKVYKSVDLQTAFCIISKGKYLDELELIWERNDGKEEKLNKLIKDLEGQLSSAKSKLKEIIEVK